MRVVTPMAFLAEHLTSALAPSPAAPTSRALAVRAFGCWYPAKPLRRKSTGTIVVEYFTGGRKRVKDVKLDKDGSAQALCWVVAQGGAS